MRMGKCIIVAASDFTQEILKKEQNDLLIVADAGYLNFKKIKNLNDFDIDLLIGDFDSLNIIPENVPIRKLNPIKDDTDVLDAIKYALGLGYKEFELYGCIGGRIEHSLANISALAFLKENNANGKIINDKQIIEILENEKREFSDEYKDYISMFSFSNESLISLKGFKYDLKDYLLKSSFPLGIDNEFMGKNSVIEVEKGKVLIIYYM